MLAEQAGMVFDRSRSSNWLGPMVGLLVAWLLWPSLPQGLIVGWVLLKVLTSVLRAAVTWQFDRCRHDPQAALRQHRRFEFMLFLDGVVFGLLGTVMLPRGDPVLALVMMCTLLGIAGAALVVLSMSLRATLALILPVLLPPLVGQLLQGDRVGLYIGIGMAIYVVLIAIEGRRASEHTRAMLRLRYQMDDLAAQRQQALDLAERNSQVKSRFMATMSHEVRTPLHGVLGLARLLRQEAAQEGEPARRQRTLRLQTLERTCDHLLAVINDALDFSRIESGRLPLDPRPLDLRAVLAEAADLARVSAAEKGLALELQNFPAGVVVMADAARVRQVLLNLLGNAVKFTPAGRVTLRGLHDASGRARIEVEDTGPGVPAEHRERVFEPFEQLDSSFARQHGGTGLGLAISRQLVRAMGGELDCGAAPAGGAIFRWQLGLPVVDAPAAVERAALPAHRGPLVAAGAVAPRVLLAEDNPVNAILAETWLQRLGVEVQVVGDGEQAVQHALRGESDLVLMDCQMPGLDGFAATERIRDHEGRHGGLARHGGRLPIVALTANALQGDRERSLAAGMDEHLAKPFDETELHATLVRHLAAPRPMVQHGRAA